MVVSGIILATEKLRRSWLLAVDAGTGPPGQSDPGTGSLGSLGSLGTTGGDLPEPAYAQLLDLTNSIREL